jgi:hypothetical protein
VECDHQNRRSFCGARYFQKPNEIVSVAPYQIAGSEPDPSACNPNGVAEMTDHLM